MIFYLYGKKTRIYELCMKKRSKSVKNLKSKYLLSKGLLEKKLKRLYRVRLRYLKLLLLLWLSRGSQLLRELYAANFGVVVVILKGIE
jgi:hypothetical protein